MSETDLYRNRAELLAKSLRERDEALERCGQAIFDLKQEIKSLREQRDAARRDFCNGAYDDPHLVARELGWDCFKGVE